LKLGSKRVQNGFEVGLKQDLIGFVFNFSFFVNWFFAIFDGIGDWISVFEDWPEGIQG